MLKSKPAEKPGYRVWKVRSVRRMTPAETRLDTLYDLQESMVRAYVGSEAVRYGARDGGTFHPQGAGGLFVGFMRELREAARILHLIDRKRRAIQRARHVWFWRRGRIVKRRRGWSRRIWRVRR